MIISRFGAAVSKRRSRYNAASGGTETTVSNYNGTGETWKVHSFTSTGTLTVTGSYFDFNILIIAGGGGGSNAGGQYGGGGGAGGRIAQTKSLSVDSYTATVATAVGAGSNGTNSVFDGTTATGGGTASNSGGSGGGGSQIFSVPGAGIAGQGHNGAAADFFGGAGGGAGAAPSPYWIGGAGTVSNITGANVTYSIGGNGIGGGGTQPGYGSGGNSNTPGTSNAGGGNAGVVIVAYRIG
jgi:hypothetical protein